MNATTLPLLVVGQPPLGQRVVIRRVPNQKPIKVTREMREDYARRVAKELMDWAARTGR